MSDFPFLKQFFQSATDQPLEAGDPRYVPLYTNSAVLRDDPVELLASAIRFSAGQSIQLLSGFRGTGKTTELKRLESKLVEEGYKVVFLDMDFYLNTSTRAGHRRATPIALPARKPLLHPQASVARPRY